MTMITAGVEHIVLSPKDNKQGYLYSDKHWEIDSSSCVSLGLYRENIFLILQSSCQQWPT